MSRPRAVIAFLSDADIVLAEKVGRARHAFARSAGIADSNGYVRDARAIAYDTDGAGAELAVARLFDVPWDGTVGEVRSSDVGPYEVRQTRHLEGRLRVLPRNPDDRPYILATGEIPAYRIVGWLLGRDCKRPEWLVSPGLAREARWLKHPAYFVPQHALRNLRELGPLPGLDDFLN